MSSETAQQVRKKLFLQNSEVMFDQLEGWYDQHPLATLEELELEAARCAVSLWERVWRY